MQILRGSRLRTLTDACARVNLERLVGVVSCRVVGCLFLCSEEV